MLELRADAKSKVTSNIGMKDFYKSYVERSKLKERKPVPINVFRSIIDDFNKIINNYEIGLISSESYEKTMKNYEKKTWKTKQPQRQHHKKQQLNTNTINNNTSKWQ